MDIKQVLRILYRPNHIAKTAERKPGTYPMDLAQVCNLAALPSSHLDALLRTTDVGEVWGVGPRIGKQLKDGDIQTVLDFVRMDSATVRRPWGVTLERTLRELRGAALHRARQRTWAKKADRLLSSTDL